MLAAGEITGKRDGGITVFVPLDPAQIDKIHEIGSKRVTVELGDRRYISVAQRRKAYVLLNAIASWAGYTPLEAEKALMKRAFLTQVPTMQDDFSLSNCSMTTARLFITYLIDFCLVWNVPCGEPLYALCEDITRYVYACLMNKRCAVCGAHAELHHVDAVGSGRNRKEICHVGMRCLPLCRKHHIEIHKTGRDTFLKRYILEPVRIDERIAQVFKLKAGGLNE